MAKIPFDIKYRPQIESGEYKVCIDYDWPVEILSWDCIHVNRKGEHFPILAKITCMNPGDKNDFIHWYNNEGKYDPWDIPSTIRDNDCVAYCLGHDLFIITPEEEMTEFEMGIRGWIRAAIAVEVSYDNDSWYKCCAKQLLSLARDQFIKDGYVLEKKTFHDAVEKVAPEVMKEVSENVDKTNEELTEFERELESFYNHHLQVCTYDNQGTVEDSLHDGASKLLALARKELVKEGTSKNEMGTMLYDAGFEDGKAEALKDLPRWEKDDSIKAEQYITVGKNGERFHYKGHSLLISNLTKLPGFKEDE